MSKKLTSHTVSQLNRLLYGKNRRQTPASKAADVANKTVLGVSVHNEVVFVRTKKHFVFLNSQRFAESILIQKLVALGYTPIEYDTMHMIFISEAVEAYKAVLAQKDLTKDVD